MEEFDGVNTKMYGEENDVGTNQWFCIVDE